MRSFAETGKTPLEQGAYIGDSAVLIDVRVDFLQHYCLNESKLKVETVEFGMRDDSQERV